MDTVVGSFFSHKTILSVSFPLLVFCPDVPKCVCAPSALRSSVQRGGKFALLFFFTLNSCLCEASYWNQSFYACTEHFITVTCEIVHLKNKKTRQPNSSFVEHEHIWKKRRRKKSILLEKTWCRGGIRPFIVGFPRLYCVYVM